MQPEANPPHWFERYVHYKRQREKTPPGVMQKLQETAGEMPEVTDHICVPFHDISGFLRFDPQKSMRRNPEMPRTVVWCYPEHGVTWRKMQADMQG